MATWEDDFEQRREHEERARAATALGAQAFDRLLTLATRSETGQARRVAGLIATVVGHARFDIYDLRALDVDISDDALRCLDALRWARMALPDAVPDGWNRAEAICREWGYA
ncbi:MAG: hypothetical protein JSS56_04665 [Proteobacteria bacterium]|nr:hypothetical protein [Pseudomonadota bacterium]